MSSHDWTLDNVRHLTLDQMAYFYRMGVVTADLYDAYCHLWQTSAPRFEVQACHCVECMERGVIK